MSKTHESVSKEKAVLRLRDAGHIAEANELSRWRSTEDNNWGWDGWVRSRFPELIHKIWN
jgi:hypothetical protein